MAAEKIVKEMSKADNNWYIQNSIWIAKRDEAARKAAARRKGLEEGRAEGLKQGLAEGHKQGLAEGHKQGLAEGAQKKAVEAATNMLNENDPPEKVARCTGLPIEQVQELADKLAAQPAPAQA